MSMILGISSAVISGVCDGSYCAVMRLTKKWEWENIWLLFSVTGLVLFPLALAFSSVPDLLGVYQVVARDVLLRTFTLGVIWGVGSALCGLGIYLLGVSLAYTIMMGIIAVGGSLIPMLVTNPTTVLTTGGQIILLSMAITTLGVVVCGRAGKLRDEHFGCDPLAEKSSTSFRIGFLVCLAGGLFSCAINLAFHFADPIAVAASRQLGNSSPSFRANSPIWALAMLGGCIPNVIATGYLLFTKGTWRRYWQPSTAHYWLFSVLMGALFAASITCYGVGASNLGRLGTTVAWLVFIAVGILVANLWGVMMGEWRGTSDKAKRKMAMGAAILFCSIFLASYGNYILP